MGRLTIIATPIGNLQDLSMRALDVLRNLDVLFCEDTRVTQRLLARYEIRVPLESYRAEVHEKKIQHIVALLQSGKHVGFVSDAGTPAVSDPGAWLVHEVLARAPETQIVPVPGPSAVIAALSVSGFASDQFLFLGFPPHKGRATFFTRALQHPWTVVLYESPHRIIKALTAIHEQDPDRSLCVARELTKMHETIYRGTAEEIIEQLKHTSSKGEFVIVVNASRV